MPPLPFEMQFTEQHDVASTHVDPIERHDVPPPPAKHELSLQ